ncbi:fructose-bisphosphate aldolase [Penicillium brasilianum]|uniref:Fructose-bisphosphate aldolase n=1 Tax=Penicillium brasilianum TaxID=104259 RepID=A0A1S9RBS9_PENBI|nr:fructose-bisphosphate aldolase [Penicillium brasilianum]
MEAMAWSEAYEGPVAYRQSNWSPSNASGAAGQSFGLLASDAARESPHLANYSHFRSTQILTFNHSGVEDFQEPSSLHGVITTIAYNIEQVLGLVQAATAARSPLIIQFFPWAMVATDGLLIRTAADAAKRASRAADLPFDSITVDMSHYDKEVLVQYYDERQKFTEAEPGRIEGEEDGVMDTAGLKTCMTTAEEVDDFVATGVDVLAPAFERIRQQSKGRINLALHGTNGFEPELMKRCLAAGVTKINLNLLVLNDHT